MANPGDVVVQSFSIGGSDLRAKISQVSVFESILKPYTSFTATVIDNTDILNQLLSRDGLELDLSFSQPGQDPFTCKFAVTGVEKGRSLTNLRTTTYTLSGYSRHMIKYPRVQKAFRETTATDAAQTLINEFLQPDKAVKVMDPSKGMIGNKHMPYNVNGVQIFKSIRALLERAVSSKNTSSAYILFENSKGLIVDTLENALERATSSPKWKYIQRPLGHNWMRDQVTQNFVILSLKEESRKDETGDAQAANQEVNPFDIFSHVNERRIDGIKSLVSQSMNIIYDSLRPPTHLQEVLPDRKRVANKFDSQSITIHVALNPGLTVGEGFEIEVLAPLGDTDSPVLDRISGPLLATEVRHTINLTRKRMQGTTTVKGTRGGLET